MKEIANILAPDRGAFLAQLNLQDKPKFKRDVHSNAVRRLLVLDDTTTDWYTKGLLGAMYSFPELLQMLPKNVVTGMLPYGLPTEKPYTQDCTFIQIRDKIRLTWNPVSLPKSVTTYVKINGGIAKFSRKGENYDLPVTIIDNSILTFAGLNVPLPGCDFALKVGETFSNIVLHIPPNSYPYAGVATLLSKHSPTSIVLNRNGLLDSFHASPDPLYKVALVATTLVKDAIT